MLSWQSVQGGTFVVSSVILVQCGHSATRRSLAKTRLTASFAPALTWQLTLLADREIDLHLTCAVKDVNFFPH